VDHLSRYLSIRLNLAAGGKGKYSLVFCQINIEVY
jgi:hypothetical protein